MRNLVVLLLLVLAGCKPGRPDLEGKWKLQRIYVGTTGEDHSINQYIRGGQVWRTMEFDDENVTDVQYRDGKLYDSVHGPYKVPDETNNILVYTDGQLRYFWEIKRLSEDSLKLHAPNDLVYEFTRE